MQQESIKQPDSQIVFNTFYSQKLLEIEEKHLNIPINEYLSKTINSNLKTITDNDYIEYTTNKEFINTIVDIVDTNSNCLLNGFEVGVDSIDDNVLNIKVYPGSAILNNFFIELYEPIILNITIPIDVYKTIIVLAPTNIDDYTITSFSILYYLLDEDNNPIIGEDVNEWNNEKFLPIGFFEITEKDSDLNILSFDSIGIPAVIEDQRELFDVDLSLAFQFSEIPYTNIFKNKTVLGSKSLTPLYIPPKLYTINNYNYIIPNYGQHVNNGYFLLNKLYNNEFFTLNFLTVNTIYYSHHLNIIN